MSVLRPLQGFVGMFQDLLGMLVPRLMVLVPVVCGRGTVGAGGEFVELSSSLVGFRLA